MSKDPYRGSENEARIRIAVVIDRDGLYSAFGHSEGRTWAPRDRDEDLAERAIKHYEDKVGSDVIRHLQFLEITLPTPNTAPVNLEAQPGADPLPAVTLGGRYDILKETG